MSALFGSRAVEQIRADHRKLQRLHPSQQGRAKRDVPRKNRKRVAIIGTLAAPTSSFGTPTTCTAAVLKIDPATGQLTATTDRLTVTNFTQAHTLSDGTYAKVEWHDGVWEVYWSACEATTEFQGLTLDPEDPL